MFSTIAAQNEHGFDTQVCCKVPFVSIFIKQKPTHSTAMPIISQMIFIFSTFFFFLFSLLPHIHQVFVLFHIQVFVFNLIGIILLQPKFTFEFFLRCIKYIIELWDSEFQDLLSHPNFVLYCILKCCYKLLWCLLWLLL